MYSQSAAAPALPVPRWKDPGYMNWLNVNDGLLEVKGIISPATTRLIRDFHRRIGGVPLSPVSSYWSTLAVTTTTTPGCACTFKDIDFKNLRMKTGCGICTPLLRNMMKEHKFNTIYKNNCEPSKWIDDSWEVAKAYMGPRQKSDKRGPEQTDCSNVILLWTNCRYFHAYVQDLKLLDKVREARNEVMHSPNLTLSDTELTSAFQSMIALVKDPKLSAQPDVDVRGEARLGKIRDRRLCIVDEDAPWNTFAATTMNWMKGKWASLMETFAYAPDRKVIFVAQGGGAEGPLSEGEDGAPASVCQTEMKVWLDLLKCLNKSLEQLKLDQEPVAEFLENNPDLLQKVGREWPKLLS